MPHDARGNVLAVGDQVLIPATILAVHPGDEYCNCDVEFNYPMPPYTEKTRYSALNTRQVEKAMALRRPTPGEVAYEAYRADTGGKSLATGQPIPEFSALPVAIQKAWEVAACAAINSTAVSGVLLEQK